MSSTTDPGNKSSAQIEREVEGTRARLTNTIEELRDRVSPGQMMEEAVSYFRGSGGSEMVQNLGRQLRDNPMPALLIGAGIAWMMLGGRSSGSSSSSYSAGRVYTDPATAHGLEPHGMYGQPHGPETARLAGAAAYRPAHSMGSDSISGSMSGSTGSYASSTYDASSGRMSSSSSPGIGDRVSGALHDARDAASGVASRVGGAASAAWDSVTGAASGMQDRAGEMRARAADAAYYQSRALREQGRSGMEYVVRDQPMILGAIGLVVGAAIGALVPNTEAEDRLMGETRDQLAEQARRMAEQGYEQARGVANQTLETAQGIASDTYQQTKDRLDQSGYSIERGSSALGEVARELRETVTEAVQHVTEEVKGVTEQAKEKVEQTGNKQTASSSTSSPSTSSSPKPAGSTPPNVTRL